jgi:hypothetical protein
MQLAPTKECLMRALSPLAPALQAEKRHLTLADQKELIVSFEITEDEILDDLLYPADHRALRSSSPESARVGER